MNKIKEIVQAWMVSLNPTDEQKSLAERRYEICVGCEERHNNVLGIESCKLCGCPLSKKIFTQAFNDTCPLKKWDEVERIFREEKKKNNKYKII